MNINTKNFNQRQLLLQYAQSLQNGDFETIEWILKLAEKDPILDNMVTELDEKLLRHYAKKVITTNYSNQSNTKENSMITTHQPYKSARPNFHRLNVIAASIVVLLMVSAIVFAMNLSPSTTPLTATQSTPTVYAPPPPPVVKTYVNEVWTKGDTEQITEFTSQDHVLITGSYTIEEVQEFARFLETIHSIFPELSFEIEEIIYSSASDPHQIDVQVIIHLVLDESFLYDAPIPAIELDFTGTMALVLTDDLTITQTELRIDNDSLLESIKSDPMLVMLSPELLDAMQADEDFDPFVIFNMLFVTIETSVHESTSIGELSSEDLEIAYRTVENIPLRANDQQFIDLPFPILPGEMVGLPDTPSGHIYTITGYELLLAEDYLVVYMIYEEISTQATGIDNASTDYQITVVYELNRPTTCPTSMQTQVFDRSLTQDGIFVYQPEDLRATIYPFDEYVESYCPD